MSETGPKEPNLPPILNQKDVAIIGSVTSDLVRIHEKARDPIERKRAVGEVVRRAMGAAMREPAEGEEQAPGLSVALLAESLGATSDRSETASIINVMRGNQNMPEDMKGHLIDEVNTVWRHRDNRAPEPMIAADVVSWAGNALSALGREELDDPSVDNRLKKLVVLSFATGATVGQPQYSRGPAQLMNFASANVTPEA